MKDLLMGIDIGTSACKAAVFSCDGAVVGQASAAYPTYHPHPGWAEQDPSEWWEAVCAASRAVLAENAVDPARIAGIGVDGQSWAAVAVDGNGGVLCRTPIWMDTRALDACQELDALAGRDTLFRVGGNPLQPAYTLPKILWYRRHLPEVYRKARCILQSNSFIVYRLTGILSQDLSQGYGLQCFDIRTGAWDESLCSGLGLRGLLPELFPCHAVAGTVTGAAARASGLCEGTPVAAGGLDAACGALGAGVIEAGQTQEQGGQAGGMSICTEECCADRRLILSRHVVPGKWLLQGGTTGGGGTVKWFEAQLGAAERETARERGTTSFSEMDREAAGIPAGSGGVLFLPYMAGERSPIWNPRAKGVFYGLDFSKTRAHLIRAVMEGVAFSLRHNLEAACSAGARATVLHAVGGAANSRLWTQIKADITGCRIVVPASDTATALGAAILAGVGTGVYDSFAQAVEKTVHTRREHMPDSADRPVYDRMYCRYLGLYESLMEFMNAEGFE